MPSGLLALTRDPKTRGTRTHDVRLAKIDKWSNPRRQLVPPHPFTRLKSVEYGTKNKAAVTLTKQLLEGACFAPLLGDPMLHSQPLQNPQIALFRIFVLIERILGQSDFHRPPPRVHLKGGDAGGKIKSTVHPISSSSLLDLSSPTPLILSKHRLRLRKLACFYYSRYLLEKKSQKLGVLLATRPRHLPQGSAAPSGLILRYKVGPLRLASLQYLGYGQRASVLLTSVMQTLGHKDVNVHLDRSVEGSFLSLKPSYSGTTMQAVHKRDAQDRLPSTMTSRMKNFLQSNNDLQWTIIRWNTLTYPISDHLDWRRMQDLGAIEAVLIDTMVPNFNKARGGWVPDIDPHPSVAEPLANMLKLLPKAQRPKPPPSDLQKELYEMAEHEQVLMQKFQAIPNFGGVFGNSVTEFVKHEFADRIRCINGAVTHINVLEWVPQEVGTGQINSSLTSNEAGRAVTTYRKILRVIDRIETGEEPDDELIRAVDGPVIDFWRFPKLRNKWALSALLLGLYLRRVQPYAIHTWSTEASYLLRHHTLYTLPQALRDSLDPSLQGPQAMAAISVSILENTHISQEINTPTDQGLRQRAGTLQRVIYGPGDQDFGNALVKGYAGSMYYRQTHAKYDRRRFVLVHGLSVALNRLTENHAATTKPPQTQDQRIALLDAIATDFETIKVTSGLAHVLEIEVHRQLIFDKAQGALIGKAVKDGEVEERPKKRRKVEHPRNNGLLARGGPKSMARAKQLQELQDYDSLTEKLEGIQGHIANGQRFAEFNSARFAEKRHQRAEAMGRWIRAEQVQELVVVVKALEGDLTYQAFEDSPRAAVCPEDDCGEWVFGKDRNAKHRCTKNGDPVKIVKSDFLSYKRLLYTHDALENVDDVVKQEVMAACHLKASPARDWLLDGQGRPIAELPFPVDIKRLQLVDGLVYWKEPKDSLQNFYMAVDVALRNLAPADSPLQMTNKPVSPTAVKLYNANNHKFWHQEHTDHVVKNIVKSRGKIQACVCLLCGHIKLEVEGKTKDLKSHAPCTRGKEKTGASPSDFHMFKPKTLTDIPHDISRILFYRATRGDVDADQHQAAKDARGAKRTQISKGKVAKEEKEMTITEWKAVLEWGR
ncbi:hypothetical protein M408DRAFT_6068 [Serendipita vermifera MAFF 305830]|uniref:Uncharacterized protein n=1 Tax=Serendipita vermifera MAFF 305830 TaxID=933852 RepID=A0A0C2XXR2_SERVB|nr:hypothetical protein M408DRAFT_6068 [Serendipita vermifera MAFF 305830]